MKMKTAQRLCAVIAGCTVPVALAGAAAGAATPPDNLRTTGSDSFVTTTTCADPVRVDSTWDVMVHVQYDATGSASRLMFTGTTRITYTDLANGHSYSPNSSGPGTVDLATGQTWLRGSNGAVFTNDGVLVSTTGRIIEDADGNIVSIRGAQRPVCAALGTAQA
jgi:hypothetical protein